VELLGVTEGVVRVRLAGRGCRSTEAAVTDAIERAVSTAAPEVTGVEVERERTLLQIGPRPR